MPDKTDKKGEVTPSAPWWDVPKDDYASRQVLMMAARGVSQTEIARHLGISVSTLTHRYSRELKEAKHTLDTDVFGHLYDRCRKGDTAAIIFWCKTRLGMRETASLSELLGAVVSQNVQFVEVEETKPKLLNGNLNGHHHEDDNS